MKIHTIIITLAAVAAFVTPASAEKVSLTLNQVYVLNANIAQLDAGVTHVVKRPAVDGNEAPPPQVIKTAYDFAPAVRLAIFRNQRAFAGELDDFQKARQALVKKIWGDRKPDEAKDVAEVARYRKELAELCATSVKVEITKLSAKDLIGPGNPIPTQVLLELAPILTD